ncbi:MULTISPECIES: flavin reductase family protein, partial [unclassified Salmonella]
MDAMFYIQASTKQQASYIFSTLSPKPTANCQLTDLQNETVVPSISPISLSLNPWSINSQSRTRELSMATHGLNLICAVTDEHTRQIVDFCDNLGQQLKDPDDKSAWVKLINSECALLNSPRLYPVLLEPETPAQFEIFVPAPEDGDHDTVIASVVEECFGDECRYRATDKAFAMSEKPIIRLEAHFNDKREKVLELTFSSFNLSLSASVYEHQLRQILLLCEDFGVRLQGRAGASC